MFLVNTLVIGEWPVCNACSYKKYTFCEFPQWLIKINFLSEKKQKGDQQSNTIHSTKFACVTHGMCQLKKNMENWMSIINFKLSNQFIPSNWKALWQLWRSARSGDFGDFSNHTNWNLSFFSLLNFGEKLPRSLGRVTILG